ncbi:MAG: hypothetical protein ACP5DZ_01420 [Bacteroidales bacterium]
MFTPIRNTYIPLIIFLLAAITMVSACKNSTEETVKITGEYEILMHFLQDKAYYSDSCRRYMFICGPQCKGCTNGMLYRLDSLSRSNKSIREMQFITSHDFVEKLGLENIDFTYDESWENVNIEFYNMRWYALSDTAIISKAKLTADNGDAFVRTVKE